MGGMGPFMDGFAEELLKLATPFVPKIPTGKSLLNAPKPKPVQPSAGWQQRADTKLQQTGARIKGLIKQNPSTPRIKTPRTVMGVRG
jgi:hypothetical protein